MKIKKICDFYKISIYLFTIFILISNLILGQTFTPKNYPQNYFKWPVGATIGIVANFGELRPNHYHMGLDCRTDHKENVRESGT